MNLDKVKYINGRAYIETIIKSGRYKGSIKKVYGQIVTCKNCGEECFAQDSNLKTGHGKFCSFKCRSHLENNSMYGIHRFGKNSAHWKGGRMKDAYGYILIKKRNHPFCDKHGYVREHRLIIEREIGRYLHRWEIVHHINKIKTDNRPDNLMAFKNESNHQKFENGKRIDLRDIIFDGRKAKI